MGLPGPDAGNGGKHLLLGPDYAGPIPDTGYYVHRASSNHQIVGARSLPVGGDVAQAKQRLTTIRVYPLDPDTEWTEPQWLDLTGKFQDTTPLRWKSNLEFWQVLHETIDIEPVFAGYHTHYGELAALGIQKGTPFEPDDRTKSLLEAAAHVGNGQMRVQAFADRSPDRMAWNNRQWEWVALRYEDGDFNTATHVDLTAREKWFYQAIGASPAMFRRDTHRRLAVLAGPSRRLGREPRRWPALRADGSTSGARQAVLVGHRLRRRNSFPNSDRPEQGRAALAVRTD